MKPGIVQWIERKTKVELKSYVLFSSIGYVMDSKAVRGVNPFEKKIMWWGPILLSLESLRKNYSDNHFISVRF